MPRHKKRYRLRKRGKRKGSVGGVSRRGSVSPCKVPEEIYRMSIGNIRDIIDIGYEAYQIIRQKNRPFRYNPIFRIPPPPLTGSFILGCLYTISTTFFMPFIPIYSICLLY